MQRVDGQTLSPQSDKPSRRCPQNSTDRKSLHVPLGINSSLKDTETTALMPLWCQPKFSNEAKKEEMVNCEPGYPELLWCFVQMPEIPVLVHRQIKPLPGFVADLVSEK